MSASDLESTFDVASSIISILGSLMSARAIETRCLSPTERVTPRSPISVSYPSGRASMNSCALAAFAAWKISSWLAVGNVVPYATRKQDRVLNNKSNVPSQERQFQHVDGIAVNPDGSRIRLVEAQEEMDYGRFSRTARTNYCYSLTRVDDQAKIVQDGLVSLVLERDTIEFYPS